MIAVVAGNPTHTDLITMKFLIFALCVCAANAASFSGFGSYKKYQPVQNYQPLRQTPQVVQTVPEVPVVEPYVAPNASPVAIAAKTVYNTAQAVASAPVYAAKTVYNSGKEAEAAIVRSNSDISPTGFNYVYETSNGIVADATGALKRVDDTDAVVFQGSYKYIDSNGNPVVFTYVADENGYQPSSDVLPVAPPVPEAILRSLEYIRTHPPKSDKY